MSFEPWYCRPEMSEKGKNMKEVVIKKAENGAKAYIRKINLPNVRTFNKSVLSEEALDFLRDQERALDKRAFQDAKKINLDFLERKALSRFEDERGCKSPFAYFVEPHAK